MCSVSVVYIYTFMYPLVHNSNMGIFYLEDPPKSSPKRCKSTAAALLDAFSSCHTCGARLSTSSIEGDSMESDSDDELEVVVSEIRSRAMEKLGRKSGLLVTDSFSWVFPAAAGDAGKEEESDEFLSVKSCFTRSSSASREAFFSVKTKFSVCSSLNGIDFKQLQGLDLVDFSPRLSILKELCHCEGWPFGLCRKALLLPPLPKSPAESWSWHRGKRPL